jgi:hypothetical protein
MDSHVLLWQDAVAKLKAWVRTNWNDAENLIHGPMVLQRLEHAYTHYIDKWRGHMWGIWPLPERPEALGDDPIEIDMMATGLFGCRRDKWLRFADGLKGYGGIEGVINRKYQNAGRKSLCLPFLKWVHYFGSKHAYPLLQRDKIRNFLVSFAELGMDPAPIYDHFGPDLVGQIAKEI